MRSERSETAAGSEAEASVGSGEDKSASSSPRTKPNTHTTHRESDRESLACALPEHASAQIHARTPARPRDSHVRGRERARGQPLSPVSLPPPPSSCKKKKKNSVAGRGCGPSSGGRGDADEEVDGQAADGAPAAQGGACLSARANGFERTSSSCSTFAFAPPSLLRFSARALTQPLSLTPPPFAPKTTPRHARRSPLSSAAVRRRSRRPRSTHDGRARQRKERHETTPPALAPPSHLLPRARSTHTTHTPPPQQHRRLHHRGGQPQREA